MIILWPKSKNNILLVVRSLLNLLGIPTLINIIIVAVTRVLWGEWLRVIPLMVEGLPCLDSQGLMTLQLLWEPTQNLTSLVATKPWYQFKRFPLHKCLKGERKGCAIVMTWNGTRVMYVWPQSYFYWRDRRRASPWTWPRGFLYGRISWGFIKCHYRDSHS